MSRIRTIKPEFQLSEQVGKCTHSARLMFILLWPLCDDEGRLAIKLSQLKVCLFPYDNNLGNEDIRRWLGELSANRLIVIYTNNKCEYLEVTGWHHQKIDKPTKSRFPGPLDEASRVLDETSESPLFDEPSASSREASRPFVTDLPTVGREGGDRPTDRPTGGRFINSKKAELKPATGPSASLAPLADGSLARGRRAIPPPPALYERQPGEKDRVGPALKGLADELRSSGAQERLRILETLPSSDLAKTRIIREMIEEIKNKNEVT